MKQIQMETVTLYSQVDDEMNIMYKKVTENWVLK